MARNTSHRFFEDDYLVYGSNSSESNDFGSSRVETVVFKYVSPILIAFGTAGNLLSVVVLQSKYFRRSPATFLLSVLALTDIGVLLCGLLRHFVLEVSDGRVDVRTFTPAICHVHIAFTYYLCQLSSWTLLLVTLERMAAVRWPLRAGSLFSKPKVAVTWSAIAVGLALLNCHWFLTVGLVEVDYGPGFVCTVLDEHLSFVAVVWPWLDFIVLSLIPLLVIFTCNIIMINALLRAAKLRTKKLAGNQKVKESTQITVMLIGLNVIFLLTTVPVSVYFIGEGELWDNENPSTGAAYVICNFIYYVSNSTNFLIYCVTGSKFRRALVAVVCRKNGGGKSEETSKSEKTEVTSIEPVVMISAVFRTDL